VVVPKALQRWEALFSLAQSLFDLLATGTSIIFTPSVTSSIQVCHNLEAFLMLVSTLVDLKPDNILVGFEDDSVINDFVRSQESNPMVRKIKNG
jgi:hypothetical protein